MSYLFKARTWKVAACIILMLSISSALPAFAAEAEQSPEQTIKTFNATLLEAMKKADELGYKGRYALLAPVVETTFALPFMANVSVGKYGKTLSEKQRSSFLETYTEWTTASYAGRFDSYSGERFETSPGAKSGRGIVTVVSRLEKTDGGEVEFTYLLRKTGGHWRVVDIHISGVSQLALTRSQFTDVIRNKGFDGLMSMLREKIKGFALGTGG